MEEAKKNMYAFSTTTYTGFQCTVDEETSEKFKGNPQFLVQFSTTELQPFFSNNFQFEFSSSSKYYSTSFRFAWCTVGAPGFLHRCQEQGLRRLVQTLLIPAATAHLDTSCFVYLESLTPLHSAGDKYVNGEIIPCTYPTYQPKERRTSKYESRRYERRRDGPPAKRRPKQEAPPTGSASS
jgi:hypothetical protein